MKFLFWLLGLFVVAVGLALAAHNSGYVVLVFHPYKVEMSLSAFVAAQLVFLVVGYALVRLLLTAARLPAEVRRFRAERGQTRGRTAMMEALKAFFEGRYAAAERAAERAMKLGDSSALNPIIAARAAHELRQFEKRDSYLEAAQGKSVGEETMRLMARTKFMLDEQQPQEALEALKELKEAGVRGHVGALQMELRAQQLAQNWDAALDVLAQMEKRNALDPTAGEQLRLQAYLGKIRAQSQEPGALHAIWRSIPSEFKHRSKIAGSAATAFMRLNECGIAQRILSDSLEAQWDSELLALYGDCQGGNLIEQIEQAERWLKAHSEDAGLLLALGKLCLHQQLWGKAQNYLEASISLRPSRAAYTALAQLLETLQKPDEATRYYQKAMELAQPA